MRVLVTGSAGHLGEGLVRVLTREGYDVVGLDVLQSSYTTVVGSITDRACVRRCVEGADAVVHAAALHEPHLRSHGREAFVDTNVTGTLNLLEAAVEAGVGRFVFTSTTGVFGRALTPRPAAPAAWIAEDVASRPSNVYGVTKRTAEDLCELVQRDHGLPCLVLRTARFSVGEEANRRVNELLYRQVDLDDVVGAHLLALERAPAIGFRRYVVSATTPFTRADLAELRTNARAVVRRLFPGYEDVYAVRRWSMLRGIDHVFVNARARSELGWTPRYDFRHALDRLRAGEDPGSRLAAAVGVKG